MEKQETIAFGIVFVMIVMDYLTGLMKAIHAHDVSSEKMREGLWHKGGFVLVMVIAEIIEHAQLVLDIGYAVPIIVPAATWIIITETSSIIENIGALSPELANSPIMKLFRSSKQQ